MNKDRFLNIDQHEVFWMEESNGRTAVASGLRQTENGLLLTTKRSRTIIGTPTKTDTGYRIEDETTGVVFTFTRITKATLQELPKTLVPPRIAAASDETLTDWFIEEFGFAEKR